jgi:carbamoyl-phosphate synthase large subunit
MKLLITAIGCPGFITIFKNARCLFPDLEIHGCDVAKNSNKEKVDSFFIVPNGNNKDYPDLILEYCIKNKISHLIPLSDEEIISIGTNIKKFEANKIKIFGESKPLIKDVFNKSFLYKELSDFNISPDFKDIKNRKDFCNAFNYFQSKNKKMCIKPSFSHGSRGFSIIEDIDYDYYLSKKSINKIPYDQFLKIIGERNIDLVAMEFLPGEEYSVDTVMFNNTFYNVIRSRDETINGISSKCTIKKNEDLKNISKEIYEKFKFKYIVNIQFKKDVDGNLKILEINPRIPGGIGFSILSGVEMLKIAFSKFFDLEHIEYQIEPEYGKTIEKKWKLIKY